MLDQCGGGEGWIGCSRNNVEHSGFTPTVTINLVTDCGITKLPSSQFDPAEMKPATDAIVKAILSSDLKQEA